MGEAITKDFGSFRINEKGRPEGTVETDQGVVHYTCNSPNKELLEKKGIRAIGDKFNNGKNGLAENEVLLIPTSLFEEAGRDICTIEAENLLRDISKENK